MKNQRETALRHLIIETAEGRLLVLGFMMALIYICWLGANSIFVPARSQQLLGMTAAEIIFGRAAAMALGYSQFLGHKTVIPICIVMETILVFIFYPLFVFSWYHLLDVRWFKNTFYRTHRLAETHKLTIQKYGVIGLFAFVWIPFWMTGPVVGCVIGFLIGLKLWVNMAAVLSGTYVAIFFWAFFLRQIHDRLAIYSSYTTIVLLVLLIIIASAKLLPRFLKKQKQPPTY